QQYLARIEAARVVGLFLRPRAEEGDLEAHRPVEPAGDVPPLGAVLGMRAVIARELQAMARNDLGIRRQREQLEEVPSAHQPSTAGAARACGRRRPRRRSLPNSRRRASTLAPRLDESPNRPTSIATASIA